MCQTNSNLQIEFVVVNIRHTSIHHGTGASIPVRSCVLGFRWVKTSLMALAANDDTQGRAVGCPGVAKLLAIKGSKDQGFLFLDDEVILALFRNDQREVRER